MQVSNVNRIHDLGQSIWLDFIDRKIIQSGKLQKLISEDGIRGITSNPAIFEKAISSGSDYNADISTYSEKGMNKDDIFFRMAVSDIQSAADLFRPLYEGGEVEGADGYVSLEVSPRLARNTEGTINQAHLLWSELDRENVMIKIPATNEGLPAIQSCISDGININVTLLFGIDQYKKVVEAYISGLEERVQKGLPVDRIASVASFFISRIDVMVDPQLAEKGMSESKGLVAIALAKEAYRYYKEAFGNERFSILKKQGAKPQRLLWASTGTKDPAFKDTMYVEALIGPDTVNTVPLETLEAIQDHGEIKAALEDDQDQAIELLKQVEHAGIDLKLVANKLEEEGIEKFNQPYDKLIDAIKKQSVVTQH